MAPTIRVSEKTYQALKQHAEPFVDTPEAVIRRLLGETEPAETADGEVGLSAKKTARAARGAQLEEAAYEVPLLEVLVQHGGRATKAEALESLEPKISDHLTELEREYVTSGEQRWQNRAAWVRYRLVESGDMLRDVPRGTWAISEQGRRRLEETRER